jgi:hypothetical protein
LTRVAALADDPGGTASARTEAVSWTLPHLKAILAPDGNFQQLFIDLEANPFHDAVLAPRGQGNVPLALGLGCDPILRYCTAHQTAEPTIHRA